MQPTPTPTPDEVERTRATAFELLQAAQDSYDAALKEHEEFRRTRWLPTPRRRREHLTAAKNDLADRVTQAARRRDELLTSSLVLNTLTARQREQACHLSREGRRWIERKYGVPASHPGYAAAPHTTHDPHEPEQETATT